MASSKTPAGVQWRAMAKIHHDAIVERLRAVAGTLDPASVGGDFLARLSTDRDATDRLEGLAIALNLPAHPFTPSRGHQAYLCTDCGLSEYEDPDAEGCPTVARALQNLSSLSAAGLANPSADDIARFDRMLGALASLPPQARATDLDAAWKGLVPRSNRSSRLGIAETLGACSILRTADQPGYATRWVSFWETNERPQLTGDMEAPSVFWRRADGVNREALDLWFPQAGIDRSRFTGDSLPSRAVEIMPVTLPKGRKSKAAGMQLAPGDVLALPSAKAWVAGVVLGAYRDGKRSLPVLDFFDGTFPMPPTEADIRERCARGVGPFRKAPALRREPLALEGLELFGSVWPEPMERVARGIAAPADRDLGPPLHPCRVVLSRNLLYLLTSMR
jgi:hypothetical protein